MKKIAILLPIILVISCAKVEKTYPAKYIYQNDCNEDITIKSYSIYQKKSETMTSENIFVVKQGESIALRFHYVVRGIPNPLIWASNSSKDSTIIILGNKQIIHRSWLADPLYDKDNYKLVSSDKKEYIYEWTFTNDDFGAAEEIE